MSFTALTKFLRGIRFRLTLVYGLSLGVFICLFALVLSRQFLHSAQEDFDAALLSYAANLTRSIEAEGGPYKAKIKSSEWDQKKQFPFIAEGTYHIIRGLDGKVVSTGPSMKAHQDIPFEALATQSAYTHRFHTLVDQGQEFRALNLKLESEKGDELLLQVATPSTILQGLMERIKLVNFIIIPLLVIIAGVVSFILAGRALAPIKLVTETVNDIAATNLSLRLPEFQTEDEFQRLSVTFNGLLERLQKSFEAQEHFVANVSHQLNTPLAIIKGELRMLESKERTLEEHRKFNQSLREEVDRMIELVKNMLLIARIEAGQEDSFRMRPLRLDDLLITTMSRMKLKARDKRINIRFNMADNLEVDDLIIEGERQLLDSMFENLLDNAIKYSPIGSVVSILISKNESIVVSIQDEGPGIKPGELKNILEKRFRRGAMTLLPGTGIGLSIVHKIAQHHKASISYEKLQPQGSLFLVQFAKQILQ